MRYETPSPSEEALYGKRDLRPIADRAAWHNVVGLVTSRVIDPIDSVTRHPTTVRAGRMQEHDRKVVCQLKGKSSPTSAFLVFRQSASVFRCLALSVHENGRRRREIRDTTNPSQETFHGFRALCQVTDRAARNHVSRNVTRGVIRTINPVRRVSSTHRCMATHLRRAATVVTGPLKQRPSLLQAQLKPQVPLSGVLAVSRKDRVTHGLSVRKASDLVSKTPAAPRGASLQRDAVDDSLFSTVTATSIEPPGMSVPAHTFQHFKATEPPPGRNPRSCPSHLSHATTADRLSRPQRAGIHGRLLSAVTATSVGRLLASRLCSARHGAPDNEVSKPTSHEIGTASTPTALCTHEVAPNDPVLFPAVTPTQTLRSKRILLARELRNHDKFTEATADKRTGAILR